MFRKLMQKLGRAASILAVCAAPTALTGCDAFTPTVPSFSALDAFAVRGGGAGKMETFQKIGPRPSTTGKTL